jgi:hypothetical protein
VTYLGDEEQGDPTSACHKHLPLINGAMPLEKELI